jgi:lysozyme
VNITEQLIRDEGLRLKAYRDSVGKLTIGVGRNLDDEGISKEEATHLLENDVSSHLADLEEHLPWATDLSDARKGVLLNMCFNMGIGGLLQFKNTLAHIQKGEYAEAASGMLTSHWAKQVGKRAIRLSKQMATDEWQ